MAKKIKIYVIYEIRDTTRNMVCARKDFLGAHRAAFDLYCELPTYDDETDYIVEECEVSGNVYNDLFVW